jgi:hypothetical protein
LKWWSAREVDRRRARVKEKLSLKNEGRILARPRTTRKTVVQRCGVKATCPIHRHRRKKPPRESSRACAPYWFQAHRASALLAVPQTHGDARMAHPSRRPS